MNSPVAVPAGLRPPTTISKEHFALGLLWGALLNFGRSFPFPRLCRFLLSHPCLEIFLPSMQPIRQRSWGFPSEWRWRWLRLPPREPCHPPADLLHAGPCLLAWPWPLSACPHLQGLSTLTHRSFFPDKINVPCSHFDIFLKC